MTAHAVQAMKQPRSALEPDAPAKSQAVQIVAPADGWILERLARTLAAKLPYAELVSGGAKPSPGVSIFYYVNYFLYNGPSGALDVGFFTHLDESHQFLERARRMDFCVCMSRKYETWLLEHGVQTVTCIPMGYDSFRYRPRLVLGVVGLLDQPRKGGRLVEAVRQLPLVEVLTTEGRIAEEQLPDFYQRLDYVLIPATVEGGPMCLLEGLAMGKPIIAPDDVGLVPEFCNPVPGSAGLTGGDHIRLYPTGNAEALVQVVRQCYEQKLAGWRLVQDRTWDQWAQAHHHLFKQLLQARNLPFAMPHVGFRFGMIHELDVPFGIDVPPLDLAIDRAAGHLYFGEYAEARQQIEDILPRYPFAAKLLETMPDEHGEFSRRGAEERGEKTEKKETAGLGCVLAIRDRPPEYLERTLQTYAFQTLQPADKVLLDYGSASTLAAAYRQLCETYGWRYVVGTPIKSAWNLSAAYNQAVAALAPDVDVVFKNDIDVLLGENVLATAAELGRDKLCFFSCLSTVEGAVYPEKFAAPHDVAALLHTDKPPVKMLGEGIHAYPRRWFEEIGGFDVAFEAWGFEDSDLRVRAEKSIGIHTDTICLLIHQWHPTVQIDEQAASNRAHYERMKTGPVVRNGGKLVPDLSTKEHEETRSRTMMNLLRAPSCSVLDANSKIIFATRSMNEELYQLCSELLGLQRLRERFAINVKQQQITGTDAVGYFRELLALDADWVINLDEDVFLLEPERLFGLICAMKDKGFAACGLPDGGVVSIRTHNPVACNAFFNVFDVQRVRRAWQDWDKAVAARHRPEFEQEVPAFAQRTPFAFDGFEPYYGLFFSLLDAGERILYLDAQEWQDGMTTLVKDHTGEPLLLHGWYSRCWDTNPDTQSRYRIAIDYARWKQGLPRSSWGRFSNLPERAPAGSETCPTHHSPLTTHHSPLGNWAALFASNRDAFPFGDTLTYEKAAAFLGGLESVEDWGCGQSWFRRYLNPAVRYKGIDGSRSPGLDELADLAAYRSQTEGILLRHVLEHNSDWPAILKNALQSFTKRLVIVLFTPFAETTRQLAFNPTIGVPDLAFAKQDLVRHFDGVQWSLEENVPTKTQYGVEQVFYLEKQNSRKNSRRGAENAESAKSAKRKKKKKHAVP